MFFKKFDLRSLRTWLAQTVSRGWRFKITLLGLLIAAFLYLPASQQALIKFKNFDALFLAVGGMLGTIIALVFSFSMLSIQKAAETLTPSVSELYRQDKRTQNIYLMLVILCLASFVFSINGIVAGLSQPRLFPVEIVVICISFELLRIHYQRVGILLDAVEAVKMLQEDVLFKITRSQKNKSEAAKTHLKQLRDQNKLGEASPSDILTTIEKQLHVQDRAFTDFLNLRVSELTEIAQKSISRGEIHITQAAVSAITQIAVGYLTARKSNLLIYPAPSALLSGILESDANAFLNPLYNQLAEINKVAISAKSEIGSIKVIESLADIAMYLVAQDGKVYRLSWSPIGSIRMCVRQAQINGFDDAALRTSRNLLRIVRSIPKENRDYRTYLPLIECWFEVCSLALIEKKGALGNEIIKDMMRLPHHILAVNPILSEHVLKPILEKLYVMTPLLISNEDIVGNPFAAYALTYEGSLGDFIEKATVLVKQDDDRAWINPYADFIKLNEEISRHLRAIAEYYDIGSSNLLWQISQTIKHIAQVHRSLLFNPITENKIWLEEVARQVSWYITAFWRAFKNAKTISDQFAYEVCDTTAWIGIAFYTDYLDITSSAIDCIVSIVKSYCQNKQNPNQYKAAELIIALWHIRILAESKGDENLVKTIDAKIDELPVVQGPEADSYRKALEDRKRDLRERLKGYDNGMLDGATALLKQLLTQGTVPRSNENQSAVE